MTEKIKTFDVRGACSKILIEQNRLERAEATALKRLESERAAHAELVEAVREHLAAESEVSVARMASALAKLDATKKAGE